MFPMGARIQEKGRVLGGLSFTLALLVLAGNSALADDPLETETSRNPVANIEVLKHSWKGGLTWEKFNRTEVIWTAKIKNNHPDPRHICLNVEFLDEENLPVFQNGKCEVVLGLSEGTISGRIIIQSPLIDEVRNTHVVALEAHQLHSFVK